jgi:pyridinium-3,5-biscarboxylic acid mononucleotide synthase
LNPDRLRELLAAVAEGRRTPDEAMADLAELPYADLGADLNGGVGFAKLDLHRELRNGLPETVYAEGKRTEDLRGIAARLLAAHGRLLVTRLAPEPAAALRADLPEAVYHERARALTCGEPHPSPGGSITVLAAGTSDLAVAEEAAVCAAWFGHPVERLYDVGVAGLHRLLGNLTEVRRADVVIAVAGMDGALPTVVASLVAAPVVAVPTSVGYGASFGGLAALLTMLNGCAPGAGVVNIDNGFGAACIASLINHLD